MASPSYLTRLGCVGTLGITLSACVSVPEHYQFEAISKDLDQRLAAQDALTVSSTELRQRTRSLLAKPLSAANAVELALLNSPAVKLATAEYGIAQADYLRVVTWPNPILSAESLRNAGETAIEAELTASLLSIFRAPRYRQIGQAQLKAAAADLATQLLANKRQVLSAYYNHVANQQRAELRGQVMATSAARFEFARRLRDAGNITAHRLSSERDLLLDVQAALRQAQFESQRSERALGRQLGISEGWSVPARLPKIPTQPFEAQPLETDANLALVSIRAQIAALTQRYAIASRSPGIDHLEFGAIGEREDDDWAIGPVLEMPLPIFDQGKANRLSAQYRLLAAEQRQRAIGMRLIQAADQTQADLAFSRQMVNRYVDEILPLRQTLYRQSLADYNAMQIGFFDLAQAAQRQIEAGLSFIDHLRNYWQARADWSHLRAGGDPADLVGPANQADRPPTANEDPH